MIARLDDYWRFFFFIFLVFYISNISIFLFNSFYGISTYNIKKYLYNYSLFKKDFVWGGIYFVNFIIAPIFIFVKMRSKSRTRVQKLILIVPFLLGLLFFIIFVFVLFLGVLLKQ